MNIYTDETVLNETLDVVSKVQIKGVEYFLEYKWMKI